MKIFDTISNAVSAAFDTISDKSRQAASKNRVISVIKSEKKLAEKEYMILGRYYYNNLRNAGDSSAEPHCAELDKINKRLDSSVALLEELCSHEDSAPRASAGEKTDKVCEEVDLSDVSEYDADPLASTEDTDGFSSVGHSFSEANDVSGKAKSDENDDLPFES